MASSYSALKIELMATGEDDQIWGDKTNQNWLAMQQAISQSGVVNFASADQVLTLVDSSAQQPARAARLVANGTSGGARNLTLPAIDKLTVFENQLADPVTVKVAGGGAGQVVPAGRSVPLLTFATDVHAQFDYLPALTLGGNLTVNGAGSFSGPLNGQPITVGPLPVNYNGMRMDSDGASYSRYYFNYGQNTLFNYNWGTQTLTYTVNGTVAATFSNNGNLAMPGTITAPYGSFTQQVVAGVVGVGDVSMYLQTDSAASYINLNGFSCRLQYTKANGLLQYIVNNVSALSIGPNGDLSTTGWLIGTNFGTPDGIMQLVHTPGAAQGTLYFDTRGSPNLTYISWDGATLWYTLNGANPMNLSTAGANFNVNLNAPSLGVSGTITCHTINAQGGVIYCGPLRPADIDTAGNGISCGNLNSSGNGGFAGVLYANFNNGIAGNIVTTGYFQSAVWYNGQSVGVHVSGTAAIMAYAGSASAQWSVSGSDRRLKDNIKRPSRDALDVVRNLPIWSCDYTGPSKVNRELLPDPEAWPEIREHWAFSFMADEVEAALPNATIKDDEGVSVALHPQHLIATLWAAVQQLTDRLESAEAKLAAN